MNGTRFMEKESKRWCTVPALRLRWRNWEDEYIVYNCNSGDAHLLNPVAAEALKILESSTISVDELAEKVGRDLGLEVGAELRGNLHDFILRLARLGLIRPADDSL